MSPARQSAMYAALSLWASPTNSASVSPEDAPKHVGETTTVCGVVASAKYAANSRSHGHSQRSWTSGSRTSFTAVIFGDDRAKFGTPETSLRGKRICVTGQIRDYRGKPEIILDDRSQLAEASILPLAGAGSRRGSVSSRSPCLDDPADRGCGSHK